MSRRRPGWAVRLIALLAAAGLGLLTSGLAASPPRPPRPSDAPAGARAASALPPLSPAAPVEVRIPAIGVQARLVPVGADARGELQVPPLDQPEIAGWYRHGATPGEAGNAVLVGHVDTTTGPAVFFDLGRLRPGNTVRVMRADGSVATFGVDGVAAYPKDRFPTDLVYGPNRAAGLRLVTCGGRFDPDRRGYVDNVIVFATRVP